MRFGKRHKHRPPVHQNMALAPVDDAIDSEERSALLSQPATTQDAMDSATVREEPNQRLLTTLRQFHHTVQHRETRAWTDNTMAHLVEALEIALEERWQPVAAALTDTGRILQSYENANNPDEAIPFLEKGHQLLCLMVTDLLVGEVSHGVQEKWGRHYEQAVMAIHAAGLELAHDHNGDEQPSGGTEEMNAPAANREPDDLHESATPFEEATDSKGSAADAEEELPTLDELPPLESMLDTGLEPGSDSLEALAPPRTTVPMRKPSSDVLGKHGGGLVDWMEREKDGARHSFGNVTFLGGEHEEEAEPENSAPAATTPEKPSSGQGPNQPPRIVVEILDRFCDHLDTVHGASPEDRALALERLEGAISVLKREAAKAQHEPAAALCETMGELCVLASITDGPLNERFMDLGYAFGGAYMEAMNEEDSRAVTNWKIECDLLIETWDQESTTQDGMDAVADDPEESLLAHGDAAGDPATEIVFDDDSDTGGQAELLGIDEVNDDMTQDAGVEEIGVTEDVQREPEVPEMTIIETEEMDVQASMSTDDSSLADSEDGSEHVDSTLSGRLLASAQQAASQGDGAGAKFFALRAAASIAKDETLKAERLLRETEIRLKESMESTEKARDQVKSAEDSVMKAATEAAERESELGSAQVQRGRAAQHLEELQAGIAEIEEQIRALQAKREAELKKAGDSSKKLEEVQQAEKMAEARLADQRKAENQARLDLESCRQEVKNYQRLSLEIETEVEKARERLTQQKSSLTDIEQTIEQICGNEKRPLSSNDSMLF